MRSFLYQVEFAIRGLLRRKIKNFSIFLLFILLVFLFSSIELLMSSLYKQAITATEFQPEIILQNLKAGRQLPIPTLLIKKIEGIVGISEILPRTWGYYFDRYTGANYTIVGITEDGMRGIEIKEELLPLKEGEVIVGEGILKARFIKEGDMLQLERPDGTPINSIVKGSFQSEVALWTHDVILLSDSASRNLFDIGKDEAWDIAIFIPNPVEVPKVAEKILHRLSGMRLMTKDQLIRTYGTSYGFKSGLMVAVSIACLLAFFILAYDRAAGLSREEQMEIAILKALGWETRDVIRMTMLQSLILSLTGFLVGFIAAYFYVFFLGAPVLRMALMGWSVLYPPYPLPPVLDITKVMALMFLTVIPYVAVGIVPVWRSSIVDPEVVFRT